MVTDKFEVVVTGELHDTDGEREWRFTMTKPNGVDQLTVPAADNIDAFQKLSEMMWAVVGGEIMAAQYGVGPDTDE